MAETKDLTPLSEAEVNEKLKALPGWGYKDNKISKEFKLKDFSESIDFLKSLESFVNEIDHHPDVCISYSKVKFELQRYDIGGKVTDRDFTVAHYIEDQYQKFVK